MKTLPTLPAADRPAAGKRANEVKRAMEAACDDVLAKLSAGRPARRSDVDVTLPGVPVRLGRRHLISQTYAQMIDIFQRLGFSVAYGPEVEDAWHNFDALNIPPEHPARDRSNNFYITEGTLLRSQTSTVQIRVMEKQKPPIRVVVPGRVYRPDTVDASHSFMFHQLEGLMVEENVTFGDLKAVLEAFAHAFYYADAKMRLRPHYFPFTEPSAEVDISCSICKGTGCPTCGGKGWLEIAGCGMVDPNVFDAVGIDREKYTGFAFGFGVERAAMLKCGIHDIRLFLENDVRFLAQF
jgi:phenylalanyl-tRNA synthetase alpha chain